MGRPPQTLLQGSSCSYGRMGWGLGGVHCGSASAKGKLRMLEFRDDLCWAETWGKQEGRPFKVLRRTVWEAVF